MFESSRRLEEEIRGLLGAIRTLAEGRYACLMEPGVILFECPEPEAREIVNLRCRLELQAKEIFALPAAMSSEDGGPETDPFEGWEHDELLLAFVNGRVALVLACPRAEAAREEIERPLRALVDRLLRYREAYRFDLSGRGLFLGRPKLDFVSVGRRPA
jgi:hypothetical protein